MMDRRKFLQQGVWMGLGLTASPGFDLFNAHETTRLTILHTNDVHSRVDPFPDDGGRNANKGGVAKRKTLIDKVRKSEDHVLLFDSGDIFQGTPYFNFFGGELEIKLMSELGYDATTIGNHDFDGGIDGLHKQLPHANFPFLICNYDFSDTIMHQSTKPYQIFERGGMKIGVFGLGIELDGLVPNSLYKDTRYLDPLTNANKTAALLKHELDCDFVVCLSHLGYNYKSDRIDDVAIAENSSDINLILGGHTHTFMYEPDIRKNAKGREVVINQVGFGGIMLGRIDIFFEKNRPGKCVSCKNTFVV